MESQKELGALLLRRTTRAVIPTKAGAEQSVRQDELRGTLRIGMPTSTGVREIIPCLPRFTQRDPRLHLEIMLDDRRQDLVWDAVDVAISVGTFPDSKATARLLTTYPRLIVAPPPYLERAGMPASPANLAEHRIVHGPAAGVETAWTFLRGGKSQAVQVKPTLSFSDNEGAAAAAPAPGWE